MASSFDVEVLASAWIFGMVGALPGANTLIEKKSNAGQT